MKFIDEKGKLFGKVNLFDLLILVLLVVGIFAMGSRFILRSSTEMNYTNATYTVEFTEAKECFVDAYKVGDALYENGVHLGTVTAVEVSPAVTVELLPNGSYGAVPHVTTYNIKVTATTDRFRLEGGYHVNSRELLAGTSHEISNGLAKCTGVIRELHYEGESV
jgi:hypothetical protein